MVFNLEYKKVNYTLDYGRIKKGVQLLMSNVTLVQIGKQGCPILTDTLARRQWKLRSFRESHGAYKEAIEISVELGSS